MSRHKIPQCAICDALHEPEEPHYMWSPDWLDELGLSNDPEFEKRIEPALADLDDEGKRIWRPLLEKEIAEERICRRLSKEYPDMKWDEMRVLIHKEYESGKRE